MEQEAEHFDKGVKGAKGEKRAGFTIVELLTVMSVILILMSLLIPALNSLRKFAYYVKQKNQFHGIDVALEFFNSDREVYPDSGEVDQTGAQYCGAMKLAEAMEGQDLLGFHPESLFRQDGTNPNRALMQPPLPILLYPGRDPTSTQAIIAVSMKERKARYLPLENANAYKIGDLYDQTMVNNYFQNQQAYTLPVLCDVYTKAVHRQTGKNVGMPVLYYKANTKNNSHNGSQQVIQQMMQPGHPNLYNIYNFWDNDVIVRMGIPTEAVVGGRPASPQPMASDNPDLITQGPLLFYQETLNKNASNLNIGFTQPYRADSYILMSAGFDGLYGTTDDVFNFER